MRTRYAVTHVQVVHLHVEKLETSVLSRQQHCQRAILFEIDVVDGVHDNAELD